MTLTEQWQKGGLEGFRWYYVKFKTGEIGIYWLTEQSNDELGTGGQYFEGIEEENILEVLAPVPSYEEWKQLKERLHLFVEANQSLRKKFDKERAKNTINYYDKSSPMDFLDECERDRKKNEIYKNLMNNIKKELITSDLRKTTEGNKFIVDLLYIINKALGEDK